MTPRTCASPEAFKHALDTRLRASATNGADFARKRQLLVFDRFLARVVAVLGDAATLKGGLVLELRLERARTTKDVDLRYVGSADDLFAKLEEVSHQVLGDFMAFKIGPDKDHPEIQNDGLQYDGLRFRTECTNPTDNPSAWTSCSVTQSSASPTSSSPTTYSPSPASRRRRCASTQSRPTSPRSCTPTRCLAHDRTRA